MSVVEDLYHALFVLLFTSLLCLFQEPHDLDLVEVAALDPFPVHCLLGLHQPQDLVDPPDADEDVVAPVGLQVVLEI